MIDQSSEEQVIRHELGHAAAFLYLGFGVRRITVTPDHGLHSGSTDPRTVATEMPRYHRIVALLAGPRSEQDHLSEAIEGTSDVKEARRLARERLDAVSAAAPDVTALIDRAWADAGQIVEATRSFRDAAASRLLEAVPIEHKKVFDNVDDDWTPGLGYEVRFLPPRGGRRVQVAEVMVDDVPAGFVSFAEEEGTGGVLRRVLVYAKTPDEFQRLGHAERNVRAIRNRPGDAVLVDGPQTNSADGNSLLEALRVRMTIHDHECYRAGARCVCGRE
jgi:hypothetical protein